MRKEGGGRKEVERVAGSLSSSDLFNSSLSASPDPPFSSEMWSVTNKLYQAINIYLSSRSCQINMTALSRLFSLFLTRKGH